MSVLAALPLPAALIRPRTDGQLHAWVRNFLHLHIPRRAVCEDRGHVAPFEFFGRAYFAEFDAGVQVGPRGGGKTIDVSAFHLTNSTFQKQCWAVHVGAIKEQSRRCRNYVRQYLSIWPWAKMFDRRHSTLDLLVWWHQARLEILTGSMNSVSGARPSILSLDEIEFWKWDVLQQAMNMVTSKPGIPGRILLTSTRQKIYGSMARVVEQAGRTGMRTFTFCIFEAMRRCPVGADPTKKGKGCPLFEAKDPETGLARCQMRKGGDVVFRCQHDEGHIPYRDVVRDFSVSDVDTWETSKECRRPTRRGLVYPTWRPDLHLNADLAAYRPTVGVILGGDWGWAHPTVIGFYQTDGERLSRFAELVFQFKEIDEILDDVEKTVKHYGMRLTEMFAGRDRPDHCQAFRKRFKPLRVNEFDKVQGVETLDANRHKTHWGARDVGISECRRLLRDVRGRTTYHVHPSCTFHAKEFDLYHYKEIPGVLGPGGEPMYFDEPEDENDDSMDEFRYVATGLARRRGRGLMGMQGVIQVQPAEPSAVMAATGEPPPSGVRTKEF